MIVILCSRHRHRRCWCRCCCCCCCCRDNGVTKFRRVITCSTTQHPVDAAEIYESRKIHLVAGRPACRRVSQKTRRGRSPRDTGGSIGRAGGFNSSRRRRRSRQMVVMPKGSNGGFESGFVRRCDANSERKASDEPRRNVIC